MTIEEAIKKLDENIPPHDSKMVDLEHFPIAVAWETVKEELEQTRKETAKEILLDLKYNLEASQPQDVLDGKQCASNDYHNIIGWIDEIAGEYGVEVEE